MNRIVIGVVACLIAVGCAQNPPARSPQELQPDAQAILDRLNKQCSDEPWRSEVDMIERPETRPENYATSGEVNGFVSDSKERLAKHGVRVKWNVQAKQYEVEKTQQ
jgi:hypothetical protein